MQRYTLYLAWIIACLATLGSLYFSDVRNFNPCHLCWYQRIVIFPLVIILGIAAFKGFNGIAPYVLPLVGIGIIFAAYQVAIQEIPDWQPINLCGSGPDCKVRTDIGLGPISIPMLSLVALGTMFGLLISAWRSSKQEALDASEFMDIS